MKNRYIHLFNLSTRKSVVIDRRTDDLCHGKFREYENVSKSSFGRLLMVLNNVPHGTIIYPDGYSITQDYSLKESYEILAK